MENRAETISVHANTRSVQRHNNRTIKASNINTEKTKDNLIICDNSIEDVYEEYFEKDWKAYQSTIRPARRFAGTYLQYLTQRRQVEDSKIQKGTRHKTPATSEELVISVGSRETTGILSENKEENDRMTKDILYQEIKNIVKNPVFYIVSPENKRTVPDDCILVYGLYLHTDESTNHIHMSYTYYHRQQKGQKTKNSKNKCMEGLGYRTNWEENEKGVCDLYQEIRNDISKIMYEKYGIKTKRTEESREYLEKLKYITKKEKEEYKKLKEEKAKLEEEIKKVKQEYFTLEGKDMSPIFDGER